MMRESQWQLAFSIASQLVRLRAEALQSAPRTSALAGRDGELSAGTRRIWRWIVN